ncbi:hypothetical protein HanPI659440_Chr04g0156841 [Helianthus annuus]|nr:hypothetical protein HanPI659440_Chr04g0156841 [Helianthus annuus]
MYWRRRDSEKQKIFVKKEFDLFTCMENENVRQMIERFCHLKAELERFGIKKDQEELVYKMFEALLNEQDWQYFGLVLKNTKPMAEITLNWLIERLEGHELEIKKLNKVNNTQYQQNVDLYYSSSMISKATSPKTAFSAESSNTVAQEKSNSRSSSSSYGYHGTGSSAHTSSASNTQQSQTTPNTNVFQCNIAVNLNNAQNFNEETAKQQMVFLASILESYERLVAGKIGNTNLTKEDYDQIDPEEMELIVTFVTFVFHSRDFYNYI